MILKIYFGHVGVWATYFVIYQLSASWKKGVKIKILDLTAISSILAIFSAMAHYCLFVG